MGCLEPDPGTGLTPRYLIVQDLEARPRLVAIDGMSSQGVRDEVLLNENGMKYVACYGPLSIVLNPIPSDDALGATVKPDGPGSALGQVVLKDVVFDEEFRIGFTDHAVTANRRAPSGLQQTRGIMIVLRMIVYESIPANDRRSMLYAKYGAAQVRLVLFEHVILDRRTCSIRAEYASSRITVCLSRILDFIVEDIIVQTLPCLMGVNITPLMLM